MTGTQPVAENISNHAIDPSGNPGTVSLCGIHIHRFTEESCIEHILAESAANRGGWVVTVNLDHLYRLENDTSYLDLVKQADVVVADGMPLIWAAKLQRTPLPGRVAGSSLIRSLSAAAAAQSKSVFYLGGDPGTADATAVALQSLHPSLVVAGTYCPPFGFEQKQSELNDIVAALTTTKPDIIFVALGSPKQERLIHQLRDQMPQAWWLGVGISFSFVAGNVKRAPVWIQRLGLEWIHRLCQEPRRLARRYLLEGIPFALKLLFRSWKKRKRK